MAPLLIFCKPGGKPSGKSPAHLHVSCGWHHVGPCSGILCKICASREGNNVHANDDAKAASSTKHATDTPLVTFVVPCYNSAAFMHGAIESLLVIDQPCEILLVNDGSTDDTSKIAHEYASRYDQIIAVDQENANWGGVVNNAISLARGTYFKILDSDDHFEKYALRRVLDALEQTVAAGNAPDLLITNYVYDHLASNSQRIMQYRSFFPEGRVFTWSEMGRQGLDKFIMIHAAWYKTAILRESGVELPTRVSYMDSLLLLHPMPYVKTLYYLNVEPYHYLIGREGQSVEIEVVKKHIDQQLMATRLAIEDTDYDVLYNREPNCATLMAGYVSCMMSTSTAHLFMINTPDALRKNDEIWAYLKEHNPTLYAIVRKSWAGRANRKTALGRLLARGGYTIAKKIYKFA